MTTFWVVVRDAHMHCPPRGWRWGPLASRGAAERLMLELVSRPSVRCATIVEDGGDPRPEPYR